MKARLALDSMTTLALWHAGAELTDVHLLLVMIASGAVVSVKKAEGM